MIRKGTRGPHFKGYQVEFTAGGTRRIVGRWEGTEVEVKGIELGISQTYDGYRIDRIGNSPAWYIEAWKSSGTGQISDVTHIYELTANVAQLPHMSSPVLLDNLTAAQIGLVRREAIKIKTKPATGGTEYTYDDAIDKLDEEISGGANGSARDLLDDILYGVTSYYDFNYVFRHTVSAGRTVRIDPNFNNVKMVYTSTGALLTGEGISAAAIPFALPEQEWFKIPPQWRAQFEQQNELIYEYWGDTVWSRNYYETV